MSMRSNKRMKIEPPIIGPGQAAALPDEIVMEVLLWLPAKSLLRFRAVCRSWAATISSDKFVALHMARAAPPKLLLVAPTAAYDATALYSRAPQGTSADDHLFTLDDVKGDFVDGIAAQCRGLTLLYDKLAPAYYVVNPATRAFTRLPPCEDVTYSSVGLGFDAQAKTYKVVRLFLKPGQADALCEVYTLGGCRWRPAIQGVVPASLSAAAEYALITAVMNCIPPVLANGSLHWLIDHGLIPMDATGVAIVTFSIAEEMFGWVQSPPFGTKGAHLVELGGCLCAFRDLRHASPGTFEIWKQRDYPTGTWFLDTRIDLSQDSAASRLLEPHAVRVLGAFGDGTSMQKIIMATPDHSVHAYHVMSRNSEIVLPVADTGISYRSENTAIRVCLFKESLAPVHKTPHEMSFLSPRAKATKEVLLRLPARSIIQHKLVCKQWRMLTEDKSFISSFFAHKREEKKIKIMLVGKGAGRSFFSFVPLEKWLSNASTNKGTTTPLDTKVVCSKPCHGLNLLITTTLDYLYNPCTGYRKVNSYPGALGHAPWETPNDCWRTPNNAFAIGNKNVGLGFNPVRQEHVAAVILYQFKDFRSREYHLTCSLWHCASMCFQENLLPPLPVNDMPPAYLAGVLYWMSDPRLGSHREHAIVSLDIDKEVFDVIPCPSHIAKWTAQSVRRLSVVELCEKLCVVVADVPAKELVVWKLEHGQWDRAYTVYLRASPDYSLASNVVMPLAVDPEDGRILLSTGSAVGLYDPVKETVEELYAAGKHSNKLLRSPCNKSAMPLVPMFYEESLVSYPRRPKQRFLRF